MKKIMILLGLVTVFCTVANAQMAQKSPEKRAAHMTKVLDKRLNLTASQSSMVNAILLKQASQMDSLKANPPQSLQDGRFTRKLIARNTKQQLLSVLNGDQRQQLTNWENMRREKHRSKRAAADSTNVQEEM